MTDASTRVPALSIAAVVAGAALAVSAQGAGAAAPRWSRSITVAGVKPYLTVPAVAVDRRGDVVVAWVDGLERGTELGFGRIARGRAVFARYRRAGGSFGSPVRISPRGMDADSVAVGIDGAGRALAAWESATIIPTYRDPGRRGAIYLTRLRPGRPPVTRRLSRGISAANPSLVVAPDGRALVAWWQTTSWGYFGSVRHRVMAAAGTASDGVGAAQAISADGAVYDRTGPDNSAPVVAIGGGAGAVAWRRKDGTSQDCCTFAEYARWTPDGGFSSPSSIAPGAPAGAIGDVGVAVGPDGKPRVTWIRSNPSDETCDYCATGELWELDGGLRSLTPPGAQVSAPSALALPSGGLAVAWLAAQPAGADGVIPERVQVSASAPGGDFGRPATLSAHGRVAYPPQLALDASGALVAAWSRSTAVVDTWDGYASGGITPTGFRVEAASNAGGAFALPVPISRTRPRTDVDDVLLAGAGGPVVAVWRRLGRIEAAARGTTLGRDTNPDYTPPRLSRAKLGTVLLGPPGRRKRVPDVLTVRASERGHLEVVAWDSMNCCSAQPGARRVYERAVIRLRAGLNRIRLHRFLSLVNWDPDLPTAHSLDLTPYDLAGNVGAIVSLAVRVR